MTYGVVENVNVKPPSDETKDDESTVDDTEKSDATPVVALTASETLIVHTTLNPVRAGNVFVHDRLDAVVGWPYTTNVGVPSATDKLLPLNSTVMKYDIVITAGVVENENVKPPSTVTNGEDESEDATVKSEATPVVELTESETLIVHTTLNPVRDGLVLLHASRDADVGLP
jgi:hypothetical protein